MRLPDSAQTSQPWRIHELTRDFRLEDVWALPTPGGPDDFPQLLELIGSMDPATDSAAVVRALFAIRWKLGEVLGWDDDTDTEADTDTDTVADSSRRPTIRDRLPADLRDTRAALDRDMSPFTPLYVTDREWAAEIVNRTMSGVLHLGWVPDQAGGYRGQMSVYVQRNGLLGMAYMLAIAPFRYALVYPLMLRAIGREWQARRAVPSGN
jgi:hypothetical protein